MQTSRPHNLCQRITLITCSVVSGSISALISGYSFCSNWLQDATVTNQAYRDFRTEQAAFELDQARYYASQAKLNQLQQAHKDISCIRDSVPPFVNRLQPILETFQSKTTKNTTWLHKLGMQTTHAVTNQTKQHTRSQVVWRLVDEKGRVCRLFHAGNCHANPVLLPSYRRYTVRDTSYVHNHYALKHPYFFRDEIQCGQLYRLIELKADNSDIVDKTWHHDEEAMRYDLQLGGWDNMLIRQDRYQRISRYPQFTITVNTTHLQHAAVLDNKVFQFSTPAPSLLDFQHLLDKVATAMMVVLAQVMRLPSEAHIAVRLEAINQQLPNATQQAASLLALQQRQYALMHNATQTYHQAYWQSSVSLSMLLMRASLIGLLVGALSYVIGYSILRCYRRAAPSVPEAQPLRFSHYRDYGTDAPPAWPVLISGAQAIESIQPSEDEGDLVAPSGAAATEVLKL